MNVPNAEEYHQLGFGFIVTPAEVFFNHSLSHIEKLLYGVIHPLARTPRGCWASNAYLASMVNCSKNHITKAVKSLKKHGYIFVEESTKKDGSTERKIFINPLYTRKYSELVEQKNIELLNTYPPNFKNYPPNFPDYPPNPGMVTKNIKEDSIYIGSEFLGFFPTKFKNSEPFKKAWFKWCAYKKESGKPIKGQQHAKGFISKLREISKDSPTYAVELIDNAIENGWEGIWEIKENRVQSSRTIRPSAKKKNEIDFLVDTGISERDKKRFGRTFDED